MKHLLPGLLFLIFTSLGFSDNYMLSSLKDITDPIYIDQIDFFLSVAKGIEKQDFKKLAENMMHTIKWDTVFKAYEAYGIKLIQAPSMNLTIKGNSMDAAIDIRLSDENRKIEWERTETNTVHRYYGRLDFQVYINLMELNIIESTAKFSFTIFDGKMWERKNEFILLSKNGYVFEDLPVRNLETILTEINNKWPEIISKSIKNTPVGKQWLW